MTKPACKTCPWGDTGTCLNVASPRFDSRVELADYGASSGIHWLDACSLHPDAPKPIYEHMTIFPSQQPTLLEPGFEPVSIAGTTADWGILCRRIVGYTGQEDTP